MTKAELISKISEKTGVEKITALSVVESMMNEIKESIESNESVFLRGFGTFFVKKISEKHSARNPKTGELIYVPEKNKIRFKASKKFKELINK